MKQYGAEAAPLVTTVTCADGEKRDVEFRHAAIEDRLLVMLTDVTELKRSDEKYQAIFENASEGMYQTTPDGRFLTANTSMARFFGYDSAKELLDSVTDIGGQNYVHPEERERFKRIMEEKGVVQRLESQYRRKDGTMAWASESVRAVRDENGVILYYEGFLDDITERITNERTTRVLYLISRAISNTRDLGELYRNIHAILNDLVDTTNFFIALVDEMNDRLTFTYFADERGPLLRHLQHQRSGDAEYDIGGHPDRQAALHVLRGVRAAQEAASSRRCGHGRRHLAGSAASPCGARSLGPWPCSTTPILTTTPRRMCGSWRLCPSRWPWPLSANPTRRR